jgi:hypothetical protein
MKEQALALASVHVKKSEREQKSATRELSVDRECGGMGVMDFYGDFEA